MLIKYKYIINIITSSMKRHKLRTGLTLLTNVIGMTAILIVIITSSSLDNHVTKEAATMSAVEFTQNNVKTYQGAEYPFKENELEMILSSVPAVEKAKYKRSFMLGQESIKVHSAEKPVKMEVVDGVSLENQTGNVILYNSYLFGSGTPDRYKVGDSVNHNGILYKIIGITMNTDMYETFVVPDYLASNFEKVDKNTIVTTLAKGADVKTNGDAIKEALNKAVANENYQSTYYDSAGSVRDLVKGVSVFFVGIGSISLIVSMIAIINMLLVSVNERRSQIAVLRAIGMYKYDIVLMFLMESFILVIISTSISLLIASGVSYLILQIGKIGFFLSPSTLIVTLTLAIVISLVAGVLPAVNSAKTNISTILK